MCLKVSPQAISADVSLMGLLQTVLAAVTKWLPITQCLGVL
ncbi:Uncharacterised protein [Chlamydia trachomatis]|nr:Uncharacterised protein [Chlamydia trachomatis]